MALSVLPGGLFGADAPLPDAVADCLFLPRSPKNAEEFADTISINHPDKGLKIRYTLDNSYPTAASPLYTVPITRRQTTVVRAAVFKHDRKLAERDAVAFTKSPSGTNHGIKRGEP